MPILHRSTGFWNGVAGCTAARWAGWDETAEDTLASECIYVAMMENTVTGGGEIGQGSTLDETARTLSQAGSVPGATGSPPSRTMIASSTQYLQATDDLIGFLRNDTFTIILKWDGGTSTGLCRFDMDPTFYPTNKMGTFGFTRVVNGTAAAPFMLYCGVDGVNNPVYRNPGDATYFNSGGPWWHVLFSDGTTVYCGLKKGTTKPTALSDFDYYWDVTAPGTPGTETQGNIEPSFFTNANLGGSIRNINHYSYGADPGDAAGASYYYLVVSNINLINIDI